MISSIYRRARFVLISRFFRLLGIALLSALVTGVLSTLFGIVPGVAIVISLAINTALTTVFLTAYYGDRPRASDMFLCFKDAKTFMRVIGGMAWMILRIALWTLIPVVGWIFAMIKAYSFRLTPYILINEPEIPATRAIRVSAKRTKGFRGKIFWADVLAVLYVVAVVLALVLLGGSALLIMKFFEVSAIAITIVGASFATLIALALAFSAIYIPLFLRLVDAAFYARIPSREDELVEITDNIGAPDEPATI